MLLYECMFLLFFQTFIFFSAVIFLLLNLGMALTTPTLYEYYTSGGITAGFNADKSYFTLNEKNITLYSGAMHYFRTPKELWRDRLRKFRAAGLNAVETYVPWNLHEPEPGKYDFGQGGTDMQDFLDLELFLKTAKEEDLLALVRPGPYICAEWEFGGFPSWLLREKDIKFRTSDSTYMNHVRRFFNVLLPILAALQFTQGGPIIAIQVENEYGSTASTPNFTPDKTYLKELRKLILDNNITSLLYTSDGVTQFGDAGTLPDDFLITANFDGFPNNSFQQLQTLQPNRPKMVMEYYPGWFDHWSEVHNTKDDAESYLESILKYPGSFNLYMMHGGTSFGFMAGANVDNDLADNSGFEPDTTSYDYDAILSENGDYTSKYTSLKKLLAKYADPKTKLPAPPVLIPRTVYDSVNLTEFIALVDLIDREPVKLDNESLLPMELLPINNNTGQSYGYIVYRKENVSLEAFSNLTITGHICDSVLVLLNGELVSPILEYSSDLDNFGFYRLENATLPINNKQQITNATLDLVVENWGRVNYGKLTQYYQFKGLWQGDVLLNKHVLKNWTHTPLEFKKSWNNNLEGWSELQVGSDLGPGLYKGILTIPKNQTITDTYLDMRDWKKGIVIVNGFVLGRYVRIGPQQCLYLPAPFLKNGEKEIVIFEHYRGAKTVAFADNQIYETL